jgi:hypothetical protein
MRTFAQGRRTSFRERAVIRGLDPVLVIDLLQNGKAALAGVVAWVSATDVLGLEQPFLAPWSAVLVVHATVYRAVSRGGQQLAATFGGGHPRVGPLRALGSGAFDMGAMLVVAFPDGQASVAARRVDDHRHDRHRRADHRRRWPSRTCLPAG